MNPRSMPRLVLAAVALGLSVVLGVGWSQAASAHASLVGSDPRDGARLDAVPARVSLEFSESMSAPAYIVVTAPDGSKAQRGEVAVDDADVSVALDPAAGAGEYTVAFRAVSEDGHPVSGQFRFTVAGAAGSPSASAAPSAAPSAAAPSSAASAGHDGDHSDGADGADAAGGSDGSSLGEVQVGVGVGLFAAAGGLLWWSRRERG